MNALFRTEHTTDPACPTPGDRFPAVAVALILIVGLTATLLLIAPATPAEANTNGDWVTVYNPVTDGDGDHNDVSAWWPWGPEVAPGRHHIVYSNWGWQNDFSMDVFGRAVGRTVVTPFGSRTNTGHPVVSRVVAIARACASGSLADGGSRVTVEAVDTTTNEVLGRADIAHVDRVQVSVGQQLGGWTPIGFTSRFRNNSCYQVSNDAGVHVHLELINRHRYACWIPRGYNTGLTDLTPIGRVGAHYTAQRATC